MFKVITTLMRGRIADANESFTDAQALPLLRQQLRDAATGLEAAQRAVAVVVAYHKREQNRVDEIAGQISDLEVRTLEALAKGEDKLAQDAAATIAELEQERDAAAAVLVRYEREISRLREDVLLAQQRLRALQRGKNLADATAKTQKLRGTVPNGVAASLKEAENTLARLQARQAHAELTSEAYEDLTAEGTAQSVSDRLAAAGCGPRKYPDAASVLDRLRAQSVAQPA